MYVVLQMWSKLWIESKVMFHTTSAVVTTIINSGVAKIEDEMSIARNIWLVTAISKITVNSATNFNVNLAAENRTLIPWPPQLVEQLKIVHKDI